MTTSPSKNSISQPSSAKQQQPEDSLDDVMSFIRSLLPTTDPLSPSASSSSSESESEEDQLLAQSEQLLRILDSAAESVDPSLALKGLVEHSNPSAVVVDAPGDLTPAAAAGIESANEEHTGDAGTRTRLKTIKRNKSREKMKREVEYLKIRASELEDRLVSLREGSRTASTHSNCNPLIMAAWQRIAMSQQVLRNASETDNQSLKRELRAQLKMTKTVLQTLGKRSNSSSLHLATENNNKRGRGSKDRDGSFFMDLEEDLEVAFGRLDSVFESNGLDKVTSEMMRTVQTKSTLGESCATQFVEMCFVEVTPFTTWAAENASWQSMLKLFSAPKHGQEERAWVDDCIAASAYSTHGQKPLKCRVAVKKYIYDVNRLVHVWRSQTEFIGEFSGYVADETGWATFEPLVSAPGQASSGCIIRRCVQFVQRRKCSEAPGTVDLMDLEVEKFTDYVLGLYEEDVADVSKMMENLLLDEVTEATSSGAQTLELTH